MGELTVGDGYGGREAAKRFAVLLTGHAPPHASKKYGSYGHMFLDLLKEPNEIWDIIPVVEGCFPSPEELEQYDGFVVTGSRADAHSDEDWVLKLCEVLRRLHEKRKRVLAVCFGHQVLSRALGGKTGRASVGWEIGVKEISIREALASKPYALNLPPVLRIIESHRDQVLELPPGVELMGSSKRTEVEIYTIGDHVLGIQGHPEFAEDVLLELIESRVALGMITEEVADNAKASIQELKPDREAWRTLCRSFLKS